MSLSTTFYQKIFKKKTFRNLTYKNINNLELKSNFGKFTSNGTYCIYTGKFTGRSPRDKYFVKDKETENKIWWGNVNQPITNSLLILSNWVSCNDCKQLSKFGYIL